MTTIQRFRRQLDKCCRQIPSRSLPIYIHKTIDRLQSEEQNVSELLKRFDMEGNSNGTILRYGQRR